MLTGNHKFLLLGGTVFTIVLPTQMHFSKVISAYDCTGHVEGSCMKTNISITSANCSLISSMTGEINFETGKAILLPVDFQEFQAILIGNKGWYRQ